MEFVCPVVQTTVTGWHHVAHLGLLAVVLGGGLPLTGLAALRYRASAPRPGIAPDHSTRGCEVAALVDPRAQAPRRHR